MQVKFQDPEALSNELHNIGFKGVWMLDPGIKAEKGYEVYDSGSELDVWIQTADGKPFVGTLLLWHVSEMLCCLQKLQDCIC